MMNLQERLRAQREGGQTTRCHNTPHIGHYDVAQHSFNMLLLAYELHPNPSPDLIRIIVHHDLPERYTGDVPAPALLGEPDLAAAMADLEARWAQEMGIDTPAHLSDKDLWWLKSLDKVEHFLWCQDQLALGNRNVEIHVEKLLEIFEQINLPGSVRDFVRGFEWRRGKEGVLQ